jgi:hypothetical protein
MAGKTVIALTRTLWVFFCAMDPKIREYMSKNGAKGGRANKGTESRKKIAKAAAEIRWAKWRAARDSGNTKPEAPPVKPS